MCLYLLCELLEASELFCKMKVYIQTIDINIYVYRCMIRIHRCMFMYRYVYCRIQSCVLSSQPQQPKQLLYPNADASAHPCCNWLTDQDSDKSSVRISILITLKEQLLRTRTLSIGYRLFRCFWLRHELRKTQCLPVHLSVCPCQCMCSSSFQVREQQSTQRAIREQSEY